MERHLLVEKTMELNQLMCFKEMCYVGEWVLLLVPQKKSYEYHLKIAVILLSLLAQC